MYIDDLTDIFIRASAEYGGLLQDGLLQELRGAIEEKKYDPQDEGIIEAIIKDDEDELIDSFRQALDNIISGLEDTRTEEYLRTEEAKKEAIYVYIASLEKLINLYNNGLIGRHFSAT